MFILIEDRLRVVEAFASQFEREGISMTGFQPNEFKEWLSGVTKSELNAIEGILIGDAEDRMGVARLIRDKSNAPLIAMNEMSSLEQTLELFSSGVDDVVRKPIHVREILARGRAIRRRTETKAGFATIGPIRIYFDGRDPEVYGEVLPLPRRERRILEFLVSHRGRRVTKSQIFHSIYGLFDEDVEESVVESHVSKLRKKLRARIGYDPIDSKRFLGYCLCAPPQTANPAEGEAASASASAASESRTEAASVAFA